MAALLAAAPAPARAKEVDQFSDRLFAIAHLRDASEVVDARMTVVLQAIAARLTATHARTQAERDAVVEQAFQSGAFELAEQLATPFEYWVRDDAPVDLLWADERGVYGGTIDYDDMGVGWYVEIAPVIRFGPYLVGLDKVGHFLTQGWFYYTFAERAAAAAPGESPAQIDERVRAYGHTQEHSYLGTAGTGVYSYADLASNWQGFAFYRALFAGPAPYFTQSADGHYHLVRAFHFTDWITDAWDESENPSRPKSDAMYRKLAAHIRAAACRDFRADPVAFAHATGRTQDPATYVWSGATDAVFACKRRLVLAEICAE